MTVSTTATSPTDAAFELLAHRQRWTVRRDLVDSDRIPSVDRLVDPMPAHRHTGSKPDDLRKRFYHLQLPELKPAGLRDPDAMIERLPFVGKELVEEQLGGCS